MSEESPKNLPSESDFELDLDRVFTPGPVNPEVRFSRVTPTPRAAREASPPASEPDSEAGPAPPRRSGKANFERRADDATKSFRRVVARPSTLMAAGALDDAGPSSSHGDGAAGIESASGKRRTREEMPELHRSRAHEVLEDTFHVAPLPPEGNWRKRILIFVAILVGGYAVWHASVTVWKSYQLDSASQKPDDTAAAASRLTQARNVMQAYLEAKSIPDKLKHVLEPARIQPAMEQFYEIWRNTDPAFPWAKVETQSPQIIGGRYWFAFQFRSAPGAPPVEMSLRETANGYKIDWENFVAAGARPWDLFCAERPNVPTQMRVCAMALPGPSRPYLNSPDFECYQLEHYSKPAKLLGYAAKTDRVAQDLKRLLGRDGQSRLVNVYLRFDAAAERDQVRIVDLAPEFRQ